MIRMTVSSGFFNSVAGDRRYDASWFADYFASFIGNGVFPNPSTGLQVVEGGNMTTIVKAGKGWINGYYVTNTDDYILQHDLADSSLKRIDRIVLQKSTAGRVINIVVKKGRFASSPAAPALTRNADYYELALADVSIGAGTTQIIQGNITDQRLNKSLCGIVHAVVNQVDTTSIFNQYQSWFNDYSVTKASEFLTWQNQVTSNLESWIESQENDYLAWRQAEEQLFLTWSEGRKKGFDDWFETVKDVLNTTADGNLFNLLNDHKDASLPHVFHDATDNKIYKYGFKTNQAKDGLIFVYEEVL